MVDCHIHMVLNGIWWKDAIARHQSAPQEPLIRAVLSHYQALGCRYLRDGGDRWGVCTLAAQLGMHWTFAPAIPYRGGQYGIAVLSRFPIVRTDFWPVKSVPVEQREKYYEDRVLLRALVDAGRPVAVYTSHYGLSNAERVNAVDLTLKHLKDETIPTVFMGDLNMEPDDPLIARLKTEMTDSAEGRSFLTFSADKPEIRIDYLFLRGPFRVLNAFAPTSTVSDHLPHVTDVEL